MSRLPVLRRIAIRLLVAAGIAFLLLLLLCATPYPWRMYYWLSMPHAVLDREPDLIVVLGGGGIPSESGLMRTYYGAEAAHRYPDADVVVALPGDVTTPGDALNLMRAELILRGVDVDRIQVEPRGSNTRSQAVEVRRMIDDETATSIRLLIVTSPEHMRRAVLTFRRAGFEHVGAQAASDTSIQHDLKWDTENLESSFVAESIESHLFVRYEFWHGVNYLTRSSREWTALAYYKIKGWI